MRRLGLAALSFTVILGAAELRAQAAPARDAAAIPVVNANTATEAQLTAAGLTAAQVRAVMGARPMASVLVLDSLIADGTTAEQRTAIYRRVFVPIDLNTASDAEILKIPGIGRRMLREFKEYRPYGDMARFRREIGKYVNAAEVARLEQYVMIR